MGENSGGDAMDGPQAEDPLPDLPAFVACVGSRFVIEEPGAAGPVALELVEARALPGRHRPGARESFALLFRGPRELLLPQRVHPLRHEALGRHGIFLVPIGPDERGHRYEAIFN